MKRIIRLTESDLTRIVRRVIKESNPPKKDFKDLIGKTVMFKMTNPEVKQAGDEYPKSMDYYTNDEIESQLSGPDAQRWNFIKNTPVKGEIKEVRLLAGDDLIFVEIQQYNNGNPFDVLGFYYECGSKFFSMSGDLKPRGANSFWNGKIVTGEWTNAMLADVLDNRLPCGGFDLSKSDSMGDDVIPDTLS